jgi:hypothetical protein
MSPDEEKTVLPGEDGLGGQWELTAASRKVDNVVGYAKTRGAATKICYNLQPRGDRRSKVRGAPSEIQLVEIIRSDPDRDQFPHEFHHEIGVIVDAFEQYRLACERDAGVGETPTGSSRLGSNLGRVVEVSHQVEGVVLGEEPAELRGDSLGQGAGDPGSEAENLDVGNGAQRAENPGKALVLEEKGVAA